MEKERKPRSMSDPTEMFDSEKEQKKGHGLSNFLHKLPFVSWKHHHHHTSCSLEDGDDEFYDVEEEVKKLVKNDHKEPGKKEENFKQEKIIVMVNDSTDTELDSRQGEIGGELHQDQMSKHLEEEKDSTSDAQVEDKTVTTEEKEQVSNSSEDGPHYEPPASPLPPPTKSCLKPSSCLENRNPPPLRKRSISVPEGDPNIVCRLNRHVRFSPDTVDPPPRNCRYREWIERHSNHEKGCINIKHEKRKQQLRQIHSLDINDYLSKGSKRYSHAMVSSPMPSLCCDMFL